MAVEHKTLTDPDLHEPKGVASASANYVYAANGTGSGNWKLVDANMLDTSFSGAGVLSVTLDTSSGIFKLQNDVASPGNNYYYGTDAAGAKGFHKLLNRFDGTEFTPAANTVVSEAHGLSGIPKRAGIRARCDIADLGYAVGDYVEIPLTGDITIGYDASTVWVSIVSGTISIPQKTAASKGNITLSSWKFSVWCEV